MRANFEDLFVDPAVDPSIRPDDPEDALEVREQQEVLQALQEQGEAHQALQ